MCNIFRLANDDTVRSADAAMKLGAHDYSMNPCVLEEFIAKMEQAFARKLKRQAQVLDSRMKTYISKEKRAELIARMLAG